MAAQIDIIIPRRGINDEGKGKKHALALLIGASQAEYVWLQDDDIVPPAASEEEVLAALGDSDMLILPLRMLPAEITAPFPSKSTDTPAPFPLKFTDTSVHFPSKSRTTPEPTLLERLQMAEYAAIQQLTITMARRGHAVLCSGANLVVRRSAWLAAQGDLHPEIPSGDDMFLLEALKCRGYKIGTVPADYTPTQQERLTAIVRPIRGWKAFFKQRMRWAGKAPAYTDGDIKICGALVAAANIAQLLCPLVLLIKFPIDYSLIRKREPKTSIWVALLLAVLYPYYMLVCLVVGIIRTKRTTKRNW